MTSLSENEYKKYQKVHIHNIISRFSIESNTTSYTEIRTWRMEFKLHGSKGCYLNGKGDIIYIPDTDKNSHIVRIKNEISSNIQIEALIDDKIIISLYSAKDKSNTYYCCSPVDKKVHRIAELEERISPSYFSDKYTGITIFPSDKLQIHGITEKNTKIIETEKFLKGDLGSYAKKSGKKEKSDVSKESEGGTDRSDTLVWYAGGNFNVPDKTDTKKINEYIHKKGLRFKVSFKSYELLSNDFSVISGSSQLKNIAGKTDILSLESLPAYSELYFKAAKRGLFYDIKKDLSSNMADICSLYDSHIWKRNTTDGMILTIPDRMVAYKGAYAAFSKEKFSSNEINAFDGTIESINKILKKREADDVAEKIVISPMCTDFHFGNLLDGNYRNGMFYPDDGEEADTWFTSDSVKRFYSNLNKWYKSGLLKKSGYFLNNSDIGQDDEKTFDNIKAGDYLIYIGAGDIDDCVKDNSVIKYFPDSGFLYNMTGNCISSFSKQKKASEKFLNMVYSDRKLADLIAYGNKYEKYRKASGRLKIDESSRDYAKAVNRRSSFGLKGIASYINDEEQYSAAEVKDYFDKAEEKVSKSSRKILFSGLEDISLQKLVSFQEQNQSVFYSDDFEEDYSKLVKEENKYRSK